MTKRNRTWWGTLGRIAATLVVLVVAAFLVPAWTPSLPGDRSIASLETVVLGGLDQRLLVRGTDREAPVLLWVHPGPGLATIPFSKAFTRELERHFVVVQLDQRGAGASCSGAAYSRGVSFEALVEDTIELAGNLTRRFAKDRIFLAGHGYGASMAAVAASRRPDLFHAFVAVDLLVHAVRGERESLEFARNGLAARGDEAGVHWASTRTIPYPMRAEFFRQRELLGSVGGETASGRGVFQFALPGLFAPEYTLLEKISYPRCFLRSMDSLLPDYWALDLFSSAPAVDVPVFFFTGRADHVASATLIGEYAGVLRSPRKEQVWFEESGHWPPFEEPARFQRELIERLIPIARSAGPARTGVKP